MRHITLLCVIKKDSEKELFSNRFTKQKYEKNDSFCRSGKKCMFSAKNLTNYETDNIFVIIRCHSDYGV